MVERLILTILLTVPVAIVGIVFGAAAVSRGNLLAGIPGSARLGLRDVLVIEGAVAALALYIIIVVALAWITRPRRVQPDAATIELGDDPVPPALAGFLANGWLTPDEALQGTLLDLGARHIVSFEETRPQHTVVHLKDGADTSTLTPYERRVMTHVRSLASSGAVPGDALASWPSQTAAVSWSNKFSNEVAADARRRGLARGRWPWWSRLAVFAAAAAPAVLTALAVALAPRISHHSNESNESLAIAVGIGLWLLLTALHLLVRDLRDTPKGRRAAAHWLGVRRQLRADKVFPTLPPTAVAIWDRYLGYGAALGAAGEAVRQLPMGVEDPRHAWSPFGGRWRMVTVRYPRFRSGWGRSPWSLFWKGLACLLAGLVPWVFIVAVLPERLRWIVAVVVLLSLALVGWGIWFFTLAALDARQRKTIVGRVLRVREVRASGQNNTISYYWIAVDDGTRSTVDAWRVMPRKMSGITEGQDVRAVITPRCSCVESLEVDSRSR